MKKKNTKYPLPNLFLRRIRFLHRPLYHHRTRWPTVREDRLFNPGVRRVEGRWLVPRAVVARVRRLVA
ncbi:hypothetical protein ERO13_A12G156901v2 [Gossypium hirsutum]|nr:hypothetical protein ERO13_A12G156901v2 [Gossypium hirsutum]